ncbi:TPA: hypothetical protein ACS7ZY_001402 [Providencia alcalifaciens]
MKLNSQKRWEKIYLLTIGFAIYSVFTACSYSNDYNGTFPTNQVFKKFGLAWEGPRVNESSNGGGDLNNRMGNYINGKVLSDISDSYWGSVDGYYGIVINPGMVFTLSGLSSSSVGIYGINVQYSYQRSPQASSSYNLTSTLNSTIYKYSATFADINIYDRKTSQLSNNKATNIRAALYISDSVKPQKYSYNGAIWLEVGEMRIYLVRNPSFTIELPIQCTINTPPKIDFGKVNIWDWEGNTSGTPGGNSKDVLGVANGNFMINCTGDNGAHAPAKLTLKGPTQQFANDLKMTMDATGEVAPATVRASIKSIYSPCSTSGIYFGTGNKTPPGNEVDLGELTVGSHQIPYRFSLCSRGDGFKSGAASATATVTIDWE